MLLSPTVDIEELPWLLLQHPIEAEASQTQQAVYYSLARLAMRWVCCWDALAVVASVALLL